jgi:hypothetical protein
MLRGRIKLKQAANRHYCRAYRHSRSFALATRCGHLGSWIPMMVRE